MVTLYYEKFVNGFVQTGHLTLTNKQYKKLLKRGKNERTSIQTPRIKR